jgi:opacity protein-like surface antigen
MTSDGGGGVVAAQVTDGRISSTATMLNVYYNLDSYTGVLASGAMRPYVGVGLGIGTNTISDYLISDDTFYAEVDFGDFVDPGKLTGIADIHAYHSGGTTEQLAYALEVGATTELEGGLKLDFFVRWANLGRVESSGSIVVSQTEWLSTGAAPIGEPGSEVEAPYDSVFHYTNWKEGGSLTAVDLGIRMRIQF